MSDEKLSPGPWAWKSGKNGGGEIDWWLVDGGGAEVMGCEGCENARLEVKRPADRRAIGAAWEMVKLLERFAMKRGGDCCDCAQLYKDWAKEAEALLKRIQEE